MKKNNRELSPRAVRARKFLRSMFSRKIVLIGAALVLFFVLMAIFAPVIATHDPYEQDMTRTLLPPSKEHLLGTDMYGRDTFSRLIYGSRMSLVIGVIAVAIATVVGCVIGLVSGYMGGYVDMVIQRVVECFYAIPQNMLTLALCAVFGRSTGNLTILLAIATIPGYVRMMRSQVLQVKQNDYVMASRVSGASDSWLMFKHILHNAVSPVIVMMTSNVGMTIMAEAGLSYLGLGISPPTPTWGNMVADGRNFLFNAPVLAIAPGIAVILLVLGLNMLGDGLRDALDPRLRGT